MAEQLGFDYDHARALGKLELVTEGDEFQAGRLAQFELDCQIDCGICAQVAAGGARFGPAVLADPTDPDAGYCHPALDVKGSIWCDSTVLRLAWDEAHAKEAAKHAAIPDDIDSGLELGPADGSL